ncbi:MAG: hypothetical protein NC124_08715 [Clostridium sp.]|nr:hypothetical protein [Clostridium sp.]
MSMNVFLGTSKLLCSAEAEAGAKRLVERIQSGDLAMDVLPNNYEKFSGDLEEKDYVSYCGFLKSSNGRKVINILEEEDARNTVEL